MVQSLYNAIQENNCSEQASRMSAMENSTKNASEILEKLTLSYNRCVLKLLQPACTVPIITSAKFNCHVFTSAKFNCDAAAPVSRIDLHPPRLILLQIPPSSHHNRADRDHIWSSSLGGLRGQLSRVNESVLVEEILLCILETVHMSCERSKIAESK